MNKQLKPCPFCGSDVYLEKKPLWSELGGTKRGYYGCYEYVIECNNEDCGCHVKLPGNDTVYTTDEEAKENAIKAWNRRADNELQRL